VNQEIYNLDGVPYCDAHYYKVVGSLCEFCKKPILGKCIVALGKRYHDNHFECTLCHKSLVGLAFKGNEGKPYCHSCEIQLFG